MYKRDSFFLQPLFAILLIGILYVLFPSINPSGDSYMFAHQIRSGKDLFSPHHLIYNAFYFLPVKLFSIVKTLDFISFMNSLFAIGCLIFINATLPKYATNSTRFFLILLLGSCFGFMRYATAGETYIIPLFFSLWASWWAYKQKSIIYIAFLAGIACLFHQIHIFWSLGLFIFTMIAYKGKTLHKFFQYAIGSCIVPITYFLVFFLTQHDSANIFEYIAHDYFHSEDVKFSFKSKSLVLTPISFIRTFFQVHGYIIPLLQKYWFIGIAMVISILFGVIGLFRLKQTRKNINQKFFDQQFALCHLIIFFMQLLFAAISDGNAEFMVMLPFALALFIFVRFRFEKLPLYSFALSLFIWNISAGLIPYHFLELTSDPALGRYIKEHPEEVYYIKDRQTARENLAYHVPAQQFKLYTIQNDNKELNKLLSENASVLSDIFTTRTLSRASFANPVALEFSSYAVQVEDSIHYDLGTLIISRIKK